VLGAADTGLDDVGVTDGAVVLGAADTGLDDVGVIEGVVVG
jgi:hypothetical protein